MTGYTTKIFLGNGDGTFSSGSSIAPNGSDFGTPAVGDFNGDGKLDSGPTGWQQRNCTPRQWGWYVRSSGKLSDYVLRFFSGSRGR